VASGYYRDEAATAKALGSDGWFGTGDLASLSAGGWVNIVDRCKDLIKSGGEWISSIDVENAAMSLPGVAQCAVIATPHPKWGERPLLVVVPSRGGKPSKTAILEALGNRLAKWQVPDDVVFLEQLPLTATGKISKAELRSRLAANKAGCF
jgi:fatty-acyl-CoA synthase